MALLKSLLSAGFLLIPFNWKVLFNYKSKVCFGWQIDEHVQREIMNHRSLRHPNIVRFKEVFVAIPIGCTGSCAMLKCY